MITLHWVLAAGWVIPACGFTLVIILRIFDHQ